MKKYKLNEDFGGMKAGAIIETEGEIGSVFPSGSFELVEDAVLEVATPGGEDDNEDDRDSHIDNQHCGVIPSHYYPVNERDTTEQIKPKRGRPSSK